MRADLTGKRFEHWFVESKAPDKVLAVVTEKLLEVNHYVEEFLHRAAVHNEKA